MNEDIQDQKEVFTFQHVTCRKDWQILTGELKVSISSE